jgi:carbon-monoxide dehydrogenase medium subunit
MIPSNFEYHRAGSIPEAIKLLQEHGDEAKVMAGGHSLIPMMKLRIAEPTHLIDIGHLDRIREISLSDNGRHVIIGAACTHTEVIEHALVQNHLPGFVACGETIGDIQVRNRGTIGGSIAHADPAADWPAVILSHDAVMIARGPEGRREIPASEFFTGFYSSALEENEILTQIRVPVPEAGTKSAYTKFYQPASRFAMVGCSVLLRRSNGSISDAKVALTGVAMAAFRDAGVESALAGQEAVEDIISEAANLAADGRSVLSDHWASREYRTHLAKVYVKRALKAALT